MAAAAAVAVSAQGAFARHLSVVAEATGRLPPRVDLRAVRPTPHVGETGALPKHATRVLPHCRTSAHAHRPKPMPQPTVPMHTTPVGMGQQRARRATSLTWRCCSDACARSHTSCGTSSEVVGAVEPVTMTRRTRKVAKEAQRVRPRPRHLELAMRVRGATPLLAKRARVIPQPQRRVQASAGQRRARRLCGGSQP